jgi:hypothetical protein
MLLNSNMTLSFNKFLTESKKLPWIKNPEIGWWRDSDPLRVYHGTHKDNLESVLKNGLNQKDKDTGKISLALDPFTAFGYAAMSGGESSFRKAGEKAVTTSIEDRVVVIFEIPMEWILEFYDETLSGNVGIAKVHLKDKEIYDKWNKTDKEYYAVTELRVKQVVPKKFIVGYSFKN